MLISCLTYSSLVWAVCMFTPQVVIHMFTSNAELVSFTVEAIRVYMAVSWCLAHRSPVSRRSLRLEMQKLQFSGAAEKGLSLIPLIFVLPRIFTGSVTMAVFTAEPLADACAVSVTVILFIISFRRLLRVQSKIDCSVLWTPAIAAVLRNPRCCAACSYRLAVRCPCEAAGEPAHSHGRRPGLSS